MLAPPCRLLIGPLFNPDLIGAYAEHPDIKLFMPLSGLTDHYDYDLVYDLKKIRHFNQILEGLPKGWEPDLVIWWDPVYQPLPPGIEDCPYPTALIPGDWNLAFLSVLQSARCFDAIFADGRLGPILKQTGLSRVFHWPGFAYDSRKIYRERLESERPYDICFIGNMNPSIHPRRSRYLAEVLKLQDRYRLFLRQGVWGDDYRHVLNQSKIVFNYTICQVMNMRAYEAPACGALLFIEAENQEVRDIFSDGVSCILYTVENLLEKLEYYLEHESERAKIAEAGWQIVQAYSYERHFERLLAQIPELLANLNDSSLAERRIALQQHPVRRQLLALNQMSASNRLGVTQAAIHLDEQRELISTGITLDQIWELNAVLVMLFPYLDENQQLLPIYNTSLKDLRDGFEAALQLAPDHAILHYHFALVSEYLNHHDQALWSYSRSIELMAQGKSASLVEFCDFVLPFNKSGRGTDQSVFEWERISYESIEQGISPQMGYVRLLCSSIWQRIGQILIHQKRHDKALIAYRNAYENFPRASLLLAICQLYPGLNRTDEMMPQFKQMLEVQPLMISHLAEVLTPDLLIRHAAEIKAWAGAYLQIYPELKALVVLADLALWAESANPAPWPWKNLLTVDLSPFFYQTLCLILQRFESSFSLQALQTLRQPLPLHWRLTSETAPDLDHHCGFYWSEQASDFSIGETGSEVLRLYNQPSSLSFLPQKIGPDQFPFLYQLQSQAHPELVELCSGYTHVILAVLEAWTTAQTRNLLESYEANWANDEQTLLLVWSPPGCQFSLGELEALLPQETQAQFAWFDHALTLPEQADLLSRSQLILCSPQAKGLFYSYWAKRLMLPAAWISTPVWLPEMNKAAFSLPSFDLPAAALKHYQTGGQFESQQLPANWQTSKALNQAWLNGLWQLRLYRQLQSDLT